MKNLTPELVDISTLKAHPRNYRTHNEEQKKHISHSIIQHGIYKNIVVAKEGTVLAGHGVWETAKEGGMKKILVIRLPIAPNSMAALKILTGDNEIGKLADIDDRELSEILKKINEQEKLLGTGYDEMQLANLLMVTRPEGEIKDVKSAMEHIGVEYQEGLSEIKLMVNFKNQKDKTAFLKLIGQPNANQTRLWYPEKKNSDSKSVRFE